MNRFRRRLRILFHREQFHCDLEEEMQFHLEMQAEEHREAGMDAQDARHAARRRFGNPTLLREASRESWGWGSLERLLQDLRYALRTLRRTPGFTAVALLSMALGIGANTAVFSIVHAVLLRPLPYKDPDRLALLWTVDPRPNVMPEIEASFRDFEEWKAQSRSFADMAVFFKEGWSVVTLSGLGEPEKVRAGFVTPNFFPMMGVAPSLGRTFSPDETQRGERLAVLGDQVWRRYFGGSAQVLGKKVQTDVGIWTVVGVMPPSFQFPFRDAQLWMPIVTHPEWSGRDPRSFTKPWWEVLGRLQPGVSMREAQAEMSTIGARLGQAYPDHKGMTIRVARVQELITGNLRLALMVLSGAVLLVLVIACTNLANLLLARGSTRARELAVRAALGAGRMRLIRQLLTESAALSLLAGGLGLLLSVPAIRLLKAIAPADIPRLDEAAVNVNVLAFTFAASVVAGALFGVVPAWKWSRADAGGALKEGGRSTAGGRTHGFLVAAEFALAMVLLTGAGLLIRSFIAVLSVNPGFSPEHALTMHVEFPDSTPQAHIGEFYREMIRRVGALPGVEAAGAASSLFFLGESRTHALRQVEGRPPEPLEQWKPLVWTQVAGDYFRAMGIPLRTGRYFTERDGPDLPPVAIVNETLAQRYWPGEDPVGRRLKGFDARGRNDDWLTVVGVVGDTRSRGLEKQPIAQIYEVQAQRRENTPWLVVRTAGDAEGLAAAVRATVRSVDQSVVLSTVATMSQKLGEQTARRRFQSWILAVFSAFALALAAAGIYGVMHYAVSRRVHEIGIRMALGARVSHVLAMVIGQGLRFAAAGVSAGLLASLWLAQSISGMLYGVKEGDPLTLAAVSCLLLAVALAACCIPARRAARIDPMEALRYE